jgi:uncharacterized membrane protein YhaH (DUF805 family)
MSWYTAVLKKYAVFSGRARRKEYWMFVLFNVIFSFAAIILDLVLFSKNNSQTRIFSTLYSLAVLVPSIAVGVRRLHDIGKSGWWFFISLIPLIGSIWLLVLFVTDSQPGTNKYGPNPKETVPPAVIQAPS